LASLSSVFDELNDEHLDLLDKLNPLQIEARYPEYKSKIASSMNKEYNSCSTKASIHEQP